MITNVRIDLTDEQRNVLSRAINPSAPKRLATRQDVTEYVMGCIEAATAPEAISEAPRAVSTPSSVSAPAYTRLQAIMERERLSDKRLAGKSDSYVRGWCKVKFQNELRYK